MFFEAMVCWKGNLRGLNKCKGGSMKSKLVALLTMMMFLFVGVMSANAYPQLYNGDGMVVDSFTPWTGSTFTSDGYVSPVTIMYNKVTMAPYASSYIFGAPTLDPHTFEGVTTLPLTTYYDPAVEVGIMSSTGTSTGLSAWTNANAYNVTANDNFDGFLGDKTGNYVVEANNYMELDFWGKNWTFDGFLLSTNLFGSAHNFNLTINATGTNYDGSKVSSITTFNSYLYSPTGYNQLALWVDTSALAGISKVVISDYNSADYLAIDDLGSGSGFSTVPEPGTIMLFGLGLFLIGFGTRQTKFIKNKMKKSSMMTA